MNNLTKKVFSFFRKVLYEQEIERNTHCIYCNKRLNGKQRKFCSDKCNNNYWRNRYKTKKGLFKKLNW